MSAERAARAEPPDRNHDAEILVPAGAFDVNTVEIVLSDKPDDHAAWATLERTGRLTPFQCRSWLLPWYRIVAPALGAEPLIATVQDRITGAPLMVLPLCRRREGHLRIVTFAGERVSDYNAPIFAAGFAPAPHILAALIALLRRALDHTDLLRFDGIPALIGAEPNPFAGLPQARRLSFSSWAVDLPETRAAYDVTLTSTFLKEIKRKRRRLAGHGAVVLNHAPGPDEGRRVFAALKRLRGARFAELDRTDILGDPVFCSFYETVLFDTPDPVAKISSLTVDGEIVATLFALEHDRSHCLVLSAFEAGAWKSCSPGVLAIDASATSLIERGFARYDFTIGDEAYKRDFAATERAFYSAEIATGLRGAPTILRGHIKAGVKRTLPESVLSHLRRL